MSLKENKYSLHLIFFLLIISLLQILPIIKYDSLYLNLYYFFIVILNVCPIYFYFLTYKKTTPYHIFTCTFILFSDFTSAIIYDQSLTSCWLSHDAIHYVLQ